MIKYLACPTDGIFNKPQRFECIKSNISSFLTELFVNGNFIVFQRIFQGHIFLLSLNIDSECLAFRNTFHLATISDDALVAKFDVRYAVQTLNIIATYTFRSIRCFRIRKIFIRAQYNTVYGCSQAIGSFRFFLTFIGFVGDLFLCTDDIYI